MYSEQSAENSVVILAYRLFKASAGEIRYACLMSALLEDRRREQVLDLGK